jgi:hypothetical protein
VVSDTVGIYRCAVSEPVQTLALAKALKRPLPVADAGVAPPRNSQLTNNSEVLWLKQQLLRGAKAQRK